MEKRDPNGPRFVVPPEAKAGEKRVKAKDWLAEAGRELAKPPTKLPVEGSGKRIVVVHGGMPLVMTSQQELDGFLNMNHFYEIDDDLLSDGQELNRVG